MEALVEPQLPGGGAGGGAYSDEDADVTGEERKVTGETVDIGREEIGATEQDGERHDTRQDGTGTLGIDEDRSTEDGDAPRPKSSSPTGAIERGREEEERDEEDKGSEGLGDVVSTECYDDLDYDEQMETEHYEGGQGVRKTVSFF